VVSFISSAESAEAPSFPTPPKRPLRLRRPGALGASAFADRSRLWPTMVGGSTLCIHPRPDYRGLVRRRINYRDFLRKTQLLSKLKFFRFLITQPLRVKLSSVVLNHARKDLFFSFRGTLRIIVVPPHFRLAAGALRDLVKNALNPAAISPASLRPVSLLLLELPI